MSRRRRSERQVEPPATTLLQKEFFWGSSDPSALDPVTRDALLRRHFSPANPIQTPDLFAGRSAQLRRVRDAVTTRGKHVILFGERGVGKTSLANTVRSTLAGISAEPILGLQANCEAADDFTTLWRKVMSDLRASADEGRMGFGRTAGWERVGAMVNQLLRMDAVIADDIRRILTELARDRRTLVVIDEFERLRADSVASAMTDLIKVLADRDVRASLMMVGVAASVDALLAEHASVARSLVQVEMPRMSETELRLIIRRGLKGARMSILPRARDRIVVLSKGYPYYTHQLTLFAAQRANRQLRDDVSEEDVEAAIGDAVGDVQQSIRDGYERAVRSHRAGNRFAEILLGCALAQVDQRSQSFAPADVREALRQIGQRVQVSDITSYLKDFCGATRGHVLEQIGDPRRYRYRFKDPMLGPHVIMRGLQDRQIDAAALTLPLTVEAGTDGD